MQPLLELQLHLQHFPWQDMVQMIHKLQHDNMGKLMSKFDSSEYSIRKMSVTDPRK